MQNYLIHLIHTDKEDNEDFHNFMKAWESAPEEEPEEGDMEAIERGKQEIEAGEVQDFEEAVRDIEDEG